MEEKEKKAVRLPADLEEAIIRTTEKITERLRQMGWKKWLKPQKRLVIQSKLKAFCRQL